jgi:hypothetical protein
MLLPNGTRLRGSYTVNLLRGDRHRKRIPPREQLDSSIDLLG